MPLNISQSTINQKHLSQIKSFLDKASKTGIHFGQSDYTYNDEKIKSKKLLNLIKNNDVIRINDEPSKYLSTKSLNIKYDYVHFLRIFSSSLSSKTISQLNTDKYISEILSASSIINTINDHYSSQILDTCPQIKNDIFNNTITTTKKIRKVIFQEDMCELIHHIVKYICT